MKGIIVINHGSRNEEARQDFLNKVEKLKQRARGYVLAGAFFSLGKPSVEEVMQGFKEQGITKVGWYPYFLNSGNHVRLDLPALKDRLTQDLAMEIEILPGLYAEPLLEELVFESIASFLESKYPGLPEEIEASSLDFIEQSLKINFFSREEREVVKRVIHATCDFSFAQTMRFHPQAISTGISLLKQGAKIFCDVNMVRAGLTSFNSFCLIKDKETLELSKREKITRAAAAFRLLQEEIAGSIVVIGNAPTALEEVLALARVKHIRPGLVVGVPVGFVGAALAKRRLSESDLVYITNWGPRGGSPVAAAILNALKKLV